MFSQRQWDELSSFAASFASPGGSTQPPQQQQTPVNEHGHGHHGGSQHSFFPQQAPQAPQQHHQHYFQANPQSYGSQPIIQQSPQPQQFQQQFQYGAAHQVQPQWSRSGAPQVLGHSTPPEVSHGGQDLSRDFGLSTGGEMDWTPASDFDNAFQPQSFGIQHGSSMESNNMDFRSSHPMQSGDRQVINEGSGSANGRSGVGRLVAQFENKNFSPALPPRPTSNAMASPIAIDQQYQQQAQSFDHQASSPFSFDHRHNNNNPFNNHSFNSNRFGSPESHRFNSPDSHFGSFDTMQSRVTSPIATGSGPISFGSFHDASRVTSPAAGPTSDPFGSIDYLTGGRLNTSISHSPVPDSPMPTTPATSVPSGTPGFAIWRPPEQQLSQQFEQQFQAKSTPNYQTPAPFNSQPFGQGHFDSETPIKSESQSGNFLRPSAPTPKPVTNNANQFILELNPGSKMKGKAPPKPPKPRAPKPANLSLTPTVKQEPSSPAVLQPPTPMTAGLDDPLDSANLPTASRQSREQVPAQAWEGFKSTIRDLYLEQRKPLKEVMSIMADKYNFQATPKMYKTRFSQWGFVKNNTEEEVKRLLSMKFQRDAEGKVSEFVRNGKVVDLGTYLKRKGVTEYDLVDFDLTADLPSHIRCRTPTPPPAPEYLKSPDLLRAQETVVSNMRKAFMQCRQVELEMERRISWSSIMIWGAPSSELLTEANFFFEAGDVDQGGQSLMNAFNQLEVDLKQLSPQGIMEVMLGMVRRDPGLMTALCKYVAAFSTTNYDRSHPLRQIFTCLYEVQQKHGAATLSDLLAGSTPLVADELEAMYGLRHPYVARTWIDLALVYEHKNVDRLEKLVVELCALHKQMDHQKDTEQADLISLRCAIAQIRYAINPTSDGAKRAANDLWKDMKKMKLVYKMRDPRPHTYCYHCPVKVDPWSKRCRRRYDSAVELVEKLAEIRLHPYFEEDFHTTQHELDPQDAWAAAVSQQMNGNRWGFI